MRQSGVIGRHGEIGFSNSLPVGRQKIAVQLLYAVCLTVS